MSQFQKAVKHDAKLRLAITGPSGSGKTYTALSIATNLGGKVALVDTEHGSASKYADKWSFDVMEMDAPFSPERFIAAVADAEKAGYQTLVIDSLSHAWFGAGGLLEMVDDIAARSPSKNSFAAWKSGTPVQTKMVEAILRSNINIIATMRSKTEWVIQENEKGKKEPVKIGMAPIQRDGIEFEFDVVMQLDQDNQAIVQKSRCEAIAGKRLMKPGKDVAEILSGWLKGEAPAVETVDVLGERAVAFAAKAWKVTPAEAEVSIKDALMVGTLTGNMPKDSFKQYVSAVA